MRRARIKIAPNVGLASRLAKPAEIATTSLEATKDEPIDKPVVQTNSISSDLNNSICKSPANLPKTVEEAQIETIPSEETIAKCADKENVVAAEESNKETALSEESHPPLSRFKTRNKVRPVIRDGTHRVRTFSSASESEDDAGKRQSRTPLSPVKKPVSPRKEVETPQPEKTEPKGKKKPTEKSQLALKKEAMRKKFANGQVDRSKMTMFDLIYYNPTEADRPVRAKERLQMRLKPYEVEALAKERAANAEATGNAILDERLEEEEEMRRMELDVDEVPAKVNKEEEEEEEEEEAMPVPQLRLGPDGEIILDDQSLVIDTTEAKKRRNELQNAPVVIENSSTLVNYGSWRKRQRSARWTLKETARFYRALSMLGTNFSLMEKLFPSRTRMELKRKFKHEEKINRQLIDKTIMQQVPFDMTQFLADPEEESSEAEEEKKTKKTPKKSTKTPKKKDLKGSNEADIAAEGETPKKKRGRKPKAAGEAPAPKKPRSTKTKSREIIETSESDNNQEILPVDPATPLNNILNSPLGQLSMEEGGLTLVENGSQQTFLVSPSLTVANPAFARAEPGSLVLVAGPNPDDPHNSDNQLVHVYRISVPIEPVPT